MDFYINKNATLPILKLELVDDGRNENGGFHDKLQTATITFCMTDISTGIKKIGNRTALCILKEPTSDSTSEEYYIGYQFSVKETKNAGTFVADFTITFGDGSGTLIVPIRDELFIHVLEN